mmetsp:Transcript_23436/g.55304  ORF Transcript_23436/g.55304 Transcript_23436/m.55304 type:complete len:328 (-) Transcript_23436:814-1797(-)
MGCGGACVHMSQPAWAHVLGPGHSHLGAHASASLDHGFEFFLRERCWRNTLLCGSSSGETHSRGCSHISSFEECFGVRGSDGAGDHLCVGDQSKPSILHDSLPQQGQPLRHPQAHLPRELVVARCFTLTNTSTPKGGHAAESLAMELFTFFSKAKDDVTHLLDRRTHHIRTAGASLAQPSFEVPLGVDGPNVDPGWWPNSHGHATGAFALRVFRFDLSQGVFVFVLLLPFLHPGEGIHFDFLRVHLAHECGGVLALLGDCLAPESLGPALSHSFLHLLQTKECLELTSVILREDLIQLGHSGSGWSQDRVAELRGSRFQCSTWSHSA